MSQWQWALDRLYGFANWETRPPGTPFTFELARIERVLEHMGRPQDRWPAVHVGGTNGKGSTCAMVAACLREAGLRVGLFTSPHVHTVRERVQVNGVPIGEDEVIAWLQHRAPILDAEPELTTFEALTALACDHFAESAVDIAVIEVGLGGRLDTTRIVRPVVSVLTPIGLDHRAILGDTIRQISSDKVGIFRPGVPVVSSSQVEEAATVIEAEAGRLACPLTVVGRDVRWRDEDAGGGARRTVIDLGDTTPSGWSREIRPNLGMVGLYQRENAATATAVIATLARLGWSVGERDLFAGLAAARWPARFETFVTGGSAGGPRDGLLVIDGAHNPHAARALVEALDVHVPDAPRWLILGAGRGKDLAGVLDALLPGAVKVIAARADHPKAFPARDIEHAVRDHTAAQHVSRFVRVAASPAAALDHALDRAPVGAVIVATGSIFLAGDVREAWAARGGMPVPASDPPTPNAER